MKSTLEQFKIVGLHGRTTIDIQVADNTLIIVGENGCGKTTFLRILFHFLSGRWLSLVQFKFDSIVATIAGIEYTVIHDDLVKSFKFSDHRFMSTILPMYRKKIKVLLEEGEFALAYKEYMKFSGSRHSIPPDEFLRQFEMFGDSRKGTKDLQQTLKSVREAIDAQILYLPRLS